MNAFCHALHVQLLTAASGRVRDKAIRNGCQDRRIQCRTDCPQDDRDLRNERQKQKLEPAYQFMLRVRMPGGVATPEQWLVMDELARKYGNGTLKLTTRETFQMHGILKWNMKKTIQSIHSAMLDTIAACGDVNRNVMCTSNPYQSEIHREVYEWSKKLSDDLLPRTRAYHEIWLDEEKVAGTPDADEVEPMYGPLYLPRKFKIGMEGE